MARVPLIMQMHSGENGAACLSMMLSYYKKHLPIDEVRKHCEASRNGVTPQRLCAAAEHFGLETQMIADASIDDLRAQKLPVIIMWQRRYYAVVTSISGSSVRLNDPHLGAYSMPLATFEELFSNRIIVLRPAADFKSEGKRPNLLSLLWQRISNYKASCLHVLILHCISIAVDLFFIDLCQWSIDSFMSVPSATNPLFIGAAVLMILFILVRLICSVREVFRILSLSRHMAAESGSRLYKQLLDLPMSFYETHFAGDVVKRISTNTTLDLDFLNTTLPRIVDGGLTVIYMVMMFKYSVPIALACVGVEVVYIAASTVLRSYSGTIARVMSSAESEMNSVTMNGLSNIETVKTLGAERSFFDWWSAAQESYLKSKQRLVRLTSMTQILSGLHTTITSALVLFVGAYLIINGHFALGLMAAFQMVLKVVQQNLDKSLQIMNGLQGIRADLERVDDILVRTPEPHVELGDAEPAKLAGKLAMSDVTFRYGEDDELAVKGFSLDVEPGQMVALVGHSGCGKSTVLKMVSGIYRPFSGTILYDGKERSSIPDVVFHSSVGTVDQEAAMFDDSIRANLKLWDETIDDADMMRAADDACISARIELARNGYDAPVLENGRNFSGGEVQRLELARALAQEPSLLILDEFTSALDARTEQQVFDAIRVRGTTCVLAAHRYSTVMLCDLVIAMDHGSVVESGAPRELYEAGGYFRSLVDAS